jgi:hemerythrin-like domain-containing protein
MSENISLYRNGNTAALEKVYHYMRGYAQLLQSHISKENNILFRMADRILSDDDQQKLLSEFRKAEGGKLPSSEYINKIDSLAVLYEI